jgi:hypothetical protein
MFWLLLLLLLLVVPGVVQLLLLICCAVIVYGCAGCSRALSRLAIQYALAAGNDHGQECWLLQANTQEHLAVNMLHQEHHSHTYRIPHHTSSNHRCRCCCRCRRHLCCCTCRPAVPSHHRLLQQRKLLRAVPTSHKHRAHHSVLQQG